MDQRPFLLILVTVNHKPGFHYLVHEPSFLISMMNIPPNRLVSGFSDCLLTIWKEEESGHESCDLVLHGSFNRSSEMPLSACLGGKS